MSEQPPKCRFCKGTGIRWRTIGRTRTSEPCPPCEGTGLYERRLPFRERREVADETTRAATEGGPTREHGGPDKGEEETRPRQGSASVPAGQREQPTQKGEQ